jgi:hypothetical protein
MSHKWSKKAARYRQDGKSFIFRHKRQWQRGATLRIFPTFHVAFIKIECVWFTKQGLQMHTLQFRLPPWSSVQSSWLQIRFPALPDLVRSSRLERGPLSLVSTIEELLGRNSSGSCLENREYGRGDPLRWPRDTFYQQKLAPTSPTSGGRSVGILRLRAKATEFVCLCFALLFLSRIMRSSYRRYKHTYVSDKQ